MHVQSKAEWVQGQRRAPFHCTLVKITNNMFYTVPQAEVETKPSLNFMPYEDAYVCVSLVLLTQVVYIIHANQPHQFSCRPQRKRRQCRFLQQLKLAMQQANLLYTCGLFEAGGLRCKFSHRANNVSPPGIDVSLQPLQMFRLVEFLSNSCFPLVFAVLRKDVFLECLQDSFADPCCIFGCVGILGRGHPIWDSVPWMLIIHTKYGVKQS